MLLVLFNSTRALAGLAAGQGAAGAQLVALRSVAGAASGSSPVSGRMVRVESWRATRSRSGGHVRRYSGVARHGRRGRRFRYGLRAPGPPGDTPWDCHRVGPRSRTVGPCAPPGRRASGTATVLAPLAPVRGLAGFAVGGTQLEGVLGVVMRHLARTPGVRLIVIGKEVRTLAADPEVRIVAITRERRVLVPAVEQRTVVVPAEIRSIAA